MSKVKRNDKNIKECFCPKCPSYNECAKEKKENLYCSGENPNIICEYKMNGCLCGKCPVHSENGLKTGYYCIKGSADKIEK